MRQAGVIAAAGLEAVVNNYVRLSEVRCGSFCHRLSFVSCALGYLLSVLLRAA